MEIDRSRKKTVVEIDRTHLESTITAFVKAAEEHIKDPRACTTHDLDEKFLEELEPWRNVQFSVPGLEQWLDMLEALPSCIAIDSQDEPAKIRFVRSLQCVVRETTAPNDRNANRIIMLFTSRHGNWFNPLFQQSLPIMSGSKAFMPGRESVEDLDDEFREVGVAGG
jgi:hypothetical protein